MLRLIFIIPCFIFLLGCNEKADCPYHEIEIISQVLKKTEKGYKFDIGLDANIIVKKSIAFGEGQIDFGIKDIVDQTEFTSNINAKDFVRKWNILVQDLCGKFESLNSAKLSDENRFLIEKSYVESVITFSRKFEKVENVENKLDELHKRRKIQNKNKTNEVVKEITIVVNQNMISSELFLLDEINTISLGIILNTIAKVKTPVRNGIKTLKLKKGENEWINVIDFNKKNVSISFSKYHLVIKK